MRTQRRALPPEIEEIAWLTCAQRHCVSLVAQLIFDWLYRHEVLV